MSMDLYVFRRPEFVVDSAKLGEALVNLGFEAKVLHDFESADGYWPIEIAGVSAGVEIYLDGDAQEITEDCPPLEAALTGQDAMITFVWRKYGEGGTALALAAALAKLGDVVIFESTEGVVLSAEQSAKDGREFLDRAKSEGEFSEGD